MTIQSRSFIAVTLVLSLLVGGLSVSAQDEATEPFATDEFQTTWERTDAPVAEHGEQRSWIWGPGPNSAPIQEAYTEAGVDGRLVQYFDKSRMEMPWTDDSDPDSPWFITQGLLATELMTGNLQLGDEEFESYEPAEIPVAGDRNDLDGATYAVMGALMDETPRETGSVIVEAVDRDGMVTVDESFAEYGVTDAAFDDVTEHNVASVFQDFMESEGQISVDGELEHGPLFEHPLYAVGRPLTEAYWATILLAGEPQDVLTQCFERRCLTYAPDNPEGWQVESGNVGLHYQDWRYELIDEEPVPPVEMDVSQVTLDVNMPSEFAFTDDGRMFFIEIHTGQIRILEDDQIHAEPFAKLDIAYRDHPTDYGLLGLALHPDFNENGYVYAFYTHGDETGEPVDQRIVRFTDQESVGVEMTTIVDGLPFGVDGGHNAGRIAFGPDGHIYATIGDLQDSANSQDPSTPSGAVLRFTEDGAIPDDNPFGSDNPVYAYGLRNSFGIGFHPETDDLFLSDNGPRGEDEINRIVAGGNYGWPEVTGVANHPDYIDPIWVTSEENATAPTGILIPEGIAFPELAGQVHFCNWNGSELIALELDPNNPDRVVRESVLPAPCDLDIAEAPDGTLYAATSYAIYRIDPVRE